MRLLKTLKFNFTNKPLLRAASSVVLGAFLFTQPSYSSLSLTQDGLRPRPYEEARRDRTRISIIFPLTPDFIRNLSFKKYQIKGKTKTTGLIKAMQDAMKKAGLSSDRIGLTYIPKGLKTDKCLVFTCGRITLNCFRIEREYDDAGESYTPPRVLYVFSIADGDTVIGYGTLSNPEEGSNEGLFRYSIHSQPKELDFTGKGYGKEALVLIMAVIVNGGVFKQNIRRIESLIWSEDPSIFGPQVKKVKQYVKLLIKAGFRIVHHRDSDNEWLGSEFIFDLDKVEVEVVSVSRGAGSQLRGPRIIESSI